jgi:hypothetical protein
MKKLIICVVVFLSAAISKNAVAQVRLNVNVNIGSQPTWGPVGYDHVDYYYMPDIETYYYVPNRQFVYLSNGNWVFSPSLPPAYRNYDLYSGYKVVVNEPRAYLNFGQHKVKYNQYRGNSGQQLIKYSNEPKYYVIKGHPKYKGNNGNNGYHGNGNNGNQGGNGKGKGNGHGH